MSDTIEKLKLHAEFVCDGEYYKADAESEDMMATTGFSMVVFTMIRFMDKIQEEKGIKSKFYELKISDEDGVTLILKTE